MTDKKLKLLARLADAIDHDVATMQLSDSDWGVLRITALRVEEAMNDADVMINADTLVAMLQGVFLQSGVSETSSTIAGAVVTIIAGRLLKGEVPIHQPPT